MRSACIHLFGIILIAFALSCNGWGKDGHQIVAQVASHYLTNTTTYQTSKILGNYSLADVSTWPDAYVQTPEGKWSLHLHYVNLNQSNLVFVYEACQPPLADPPGCVITAIDNFTAILATDYQKASYQPCSDPNSEPCPLSFLTHFLGDSHEPLHICYGSDEGGNLYNVVYDGICTELHDVWDTRLIQTYEANNNVNWNDMANQITNWLDDNPKIISDFSFTTKSKEWGDESFIVCRFVPYNMSPGTVPAASNWIHTIYNYITPQTKNNKKKAMSSDSCGTVLPVNYYEKNIPVVFEQLAKAGIRLAYRLNSIYDPSFNGFGERN